ncbi:unnamed protein product [Lactuca saligna]|uniref:Uncharacterized protein n=1 Tax=Lactuca saligna TaxID=75948 RepID=A0AA36EIQ8_LACSI|nr:unnamed protein product [Lactuca saligna]
MSASRSMSLLKVAPFRFQFLLYAYVKFDSIPFKCVFIEESFETSKTYYYSNEYDEENFDIDLIHVKLEEDFKAQAKERCKDVFLSIFFLEIWGIERLGISENCDISFRLKYLGGNLNL